LGVLVLALVGGLGEGVVHAVGVPPRVLPGHIVVGVGVERRLVDPRLAGGQQLAEIAPQQVPIEVVRLVAVLTFDDKPADAQRGE
jgi:hypothetical protein